MMAEVHIYTASPVERARPNPREAEQLGLGQNPAVFLACQSMESGAARAAGN